MRKSGIDHYFLFFKIIFASPYRPNILQRITIREIHTMGDFGYNWKVSYLDNILHKSEKVNRILSAMEWWRFCWMKRYTGKYIEQSKKTAFRPISLTEKNIKNSPFSLRLRMIQCTILTIIKCSFKNNCKGQYSFVICKIYIEQFTINTTYRIESEIPKCEERVVYRWFYAQLKIRHDGFHLTLF